MERTGLLVFVYRKPDGVDCTAGGITSKEKNLKLVGPNVCGPFDVKPGEVYLELEMRNVGGGKKYLTAYPMVDGHRQYGDDGVTMFGGNFIYSCDDRFPSDYPIPVHDRFENWETYEALSR